MTATNHVVMGALVATYIHNPWIAIPAAVVSHFVLDSVPHYAFPDLKKKPLRFLQTLAIDIGLAASILAAILFLQPANFLLIVACGVAAASPDLMWLHYIIYKKSEKVAHWPAIVRFHSRIQREYTQLIALEAAWVLLTGGLLLTRLH